jgi:uncharacterized protein (TIGR00730 family)
VIASELFERSRVVVLRQAFERVPAPDPMRDRGRNKWRARTLTPRTGSSDRGSRIQQTTLRVAFRPPAAFSKISRAARGRSGGLKIVSEQEGSAELSDIVSLGDEDATGRVISQAVLGLWEVVNNLTRLRPTRRERDRVTVFGSARTDPDHWVYAAVRDLAAELTRLGCDIVTGGGPGLMQAANEGARAAGASAEARSVGIRVDLPFEQEVNPFVSQVFEHGTFFSRLHHFVLVSDAFVVVPGGIGTVLETMMVWQLLQVRKLYDTPLVLAGAMWADLVEWSRKSMLRPDGPLASGDDLAIPICCRTGPEIIDIVHEHHARWKTKRESPA